MKRTKRTNSTVHFLYFVFFLHFRAFKLQGIFFFLQNGVPFSKSRKHKKSIFRSAPPPFRWGPPHNRKLYAKSVPSSPFLGIFGPLWHRMTNGKCATEVSSPEFRIGVSFLGFVDLWAGGSLCVSSWLSANRGRGCGICDKLAGFHWLQI